MNTIIKTILWIIGILFLVALIFVGITVYQIWHLKVTMEKNQMLIENDARELINGDCTKVDSMESRVKVMQNEFNSACINPAISFVVDNYIQMPVKCSDKSSLSQMAEPAIAQVRQVCANETLMNAVRAKIGRNITNADIEMYMQQYQAG